MANTITPDQLGQDEDKNQPGQPGNAAPAGQAPSSSGNAPAITSSQTNNPNQQRGSGYTNISKVLQANQGNGLGSAVGNNIQQVGSQAQENLKNAQNQFNQQSQANQFNTDQNKQTVQNVLNDPTQAVNNDQGKQFQNLISGQYQGPQNLTNANQIQAQAGNLAQMGQALGSSGGRQALLQQMFGNPQYSQGQQTLDNLLLGQSQSPALQQARRAALTTQGQVQNAVSGAQAQGQQNVNQARQFGKSVQDQFGNTVNDQNQNIVNAANQAQQSRDTSYQQAIDDLKTGNVTQDEANLLGLTQGQNTFGLLEDPSKFIAENPLKANASNFASENDYAKMQALQKLGGQFGNNPNVSNAFRNYQDPTQAGQFNAAPGITGNANQFGTAVQGTQQDFLDHLAAITPGGFDAIGNMSGESGIFGNMAAQGAAGASAGGSLGSLGGAAGTAAGTAYGALAGLVGGAFSDPSANAAEARETAKQQASSQLSDYYNNLKNLAGQHGLNLGARQNMTPEQLQAWLDPENVGANYGNIIKELQGDVTANNKVNIRPNGSAYPTFGRIGAQQIPSQNPDDLENMPKVTG